MKLSSIKSTPITLELSCGEVVLQPLTLQILTELEQEGITLSSVQTDIKAWPIQTATKIFWAAIGDEQKAVFKDITGMRRSLGLTDMPMLEAAITKLWRASMPEEATETPDQSHDGEESEKKSVEPTGA